MRNLQQYPITTEEIIECLEKFAEEVSPAKTRMAGDMRPRLLMEACRIIRESTKKAA